MVCFPLVSVFSREKKRLLRNSCSCRKNPQHWKFPCYFCSDKFGVCFGSFSSPLPSYFSFVAASLCWSLSCRARSPSIPMSLLQKQRPGESRADGRGPPQPPDGHNLPADPHRPRWAFGKTFSRCIEVRPVFRHRK